MEMDKLGVLTSFVHNIIVYNIPLLYGTVGEIVVEKSGSLNLGVEGIMAVGAIFGYICGCYANSLAVGILVAFLAAALCGLLFAVMTVSLQANQNITGLTLTTFGLGVYFFVGNGLKASGWPIMGDYDSIKNGFASLPIPVLSKIPLLGEGLFSHNVLVYLGIAIALAMYWYLNHTTPGLKLRAVGENPGAADSVGINVKRMKYLHICLGCGIMGIGGYFKDDPKDFEEFIRKANIVGAKIGALGGKFTYHNHSGEFMKLSNGKNAMEMLEEGLDPATTSFCLDTCWVQRGGADVRYWIEQIGRAHV